VGDFCGQLQHAWAECGEIERQLRRQALFKVEQIWTHRLRGMGHLATADAERESTLGFLPDTARVCRIELGRLIGGGNGGNPNRQPTRRLPAQTAIEGRRIGTRRRPGGVVTELGGQAYELRLVGLA